MTSGHRAKTRLRHWAAKNRSCGDLTLTSRTSFERFAEFWRKCWDFLGEKARRYSRDDTDGGANG